MIAVLEEDWGVGDDDYLPPPKNPNLPRPKPTHPSIWAGEAGKNSGIAGENKKKKTMWDKFWGN